MELGHLAYKGLTRRFPRRNEMPFGDNPSLERSLFGSTAKRECAPLGTTESDHHAFLYVGRFTQAAKDPTERKCHFWGNCVRGTGCFPAATVVIYGTQDGTVDA